MNRVYSFSGRGRNVKETEQRPAHVGQSAVVYITIHAERSGRMLSVWLIPGMPEGREGKACFLLQPPKGLRFLAPD